MVVFQGMRHIALKVADVERSARFYEKAFGMRRFAGKYGGTFMAMVSPGLKDQISLSTDEQSATGGPTGRVGEQGGVDHFGFILSPGSSLEQAVERMKVCGATYLRHHDIAEGVPSAFFRDPDGYTFQIVKFPRFTRAYIAMLPVLNWFRQR
jgi:lactoylglutathione lyase